MSTEPLDVSVDRSDMARVIDRTPGQIEYALRDTDFPAFSSQDIHQLLVIGMGGSALPVEILNDVLEDRLPTPVRVSRHYNLPPGRGRRFLLFSSFSGNTEEVVEPLSKLPSGTPDVGIITAGGRLAEIGAERGIPTVIIPAHREPDGFQPRCASGYIVTYMARILRETGYADVPLELFEGLVPFLEDLDVRGEGERIAREIEGRIPIFYTDEMHVGSVARIAKIKMNENAKRPAFFNALPEANHNEMIGFSGSVEDYAIVYFRDPTSHPRVDRRYEVLQQVLDRPNLRFVDWDIPGKNRLQRVFAALTLADWVSYYSAILEGVDPTPVALVEEFKRLL